MKKPRRSRVISIRISEAEFEALQKVCAERRFRNVSQAARRGIELIMLGAEAPSPEESRVEKLEARVLLLERMASRMLSDDERKP